MNHPAPPICKRVTKQNNYGHAGTWLLLLKKFSICLYHYIGTDIKWVWRANVKISTVYNSCYLEAGFVFFVSGIVQGSAVPHIHRNRFGNSMHGEIAR